MIHGRHSITMSYHSKTISDVLSNIKIIKIKKKFSNYNTYFLIIKKFPILWITNTIRTKCIKLHAKSRLVEEFFKTGKIFLRSRILWKFCIYIYICCKYSWKCYIFHSLIYNGIIAAFSSLTYQLQKWFFFPQVLTSETGKHVSANV